MKHLSDEFIKKIARCLQEEEMDIYTMTLYEMDRGDLNYFRPKDRRQVKKIFDTLMKDTRHHAELLRLIVEMGTREA